MSRVMGPLAAVLSPIKYLLKILGGYAPRLKSFGTIGPGGIPPKIGKSKRPKIMAKKKKSAPKMGKKKKKKAKKK